MITDTIPPCANCQRIQAEVDALGAELEALRATVAQLQRQLAAARKDASNS
jgi:outer membrane murein-binding lipoprotein Lpp